MNCAVPANIHLLPLRRDWNFPGVGVLWDQKKNLKRCLRLNWNFQRGVWGSQKNIPWGRYSSIFSGTTCQYNIFIKYTSKYNFTGQLINTHHTAMWLTWRWQTRVSWRTNKCPWGWWLPSGEFHRKFIEKNINGQ